MVIETTDDNDGCGFSKKMEKTVPLTTISKFTDQTHYDELSQTGIVRDRVC